MGRESRFKKDLDAKPVLGKSLKKFFSRSFFFTSKAFSLSKVNKGEAAIAESKKNCFYISKDSLYFQLKVRQLKGSII